MKNLFSLIIFTSVLKNGFVFEIDVEKCTSSEGKPGFCRDKEHCFFGNEKEFTECKNKQQICCPSTGKSNEMCLKYAEAVYSEDGIAMPFGRKSMKSATCGISAVPLIVGGEKAKPMEFPHMALIGYGNHRANVFWSCGGSLISPNYVLTAAHCMDSGSRGPAKWVRLGVMNITEKYSSEVQEIEVEKRIYHPLFKLKMNDIALLKLGKSVKFTPYVRPACLDFEGIPKGKSAIATGWGRTTFDSIQQSEYLMKVQLDIIEKATCSKVHTRGMFMPKGLEDSMMCAGVLTGGKDTCQGDSGGPLQIILEKPYCMYRIIGITSYGKFCGFANSPAVYSRVFVFLPWIESIVWN